MNRTRMLALLAGAAMGAGVASAQTANNAALERELLADAGARASFQAGGTAGHDGAFFVASADGNNRLEVGGYTQFRYTISSRDTSGNDEDFTSGFDLPYAALTFGGNVINQNLTFFMRGYFDGQGQSGNFQLADAYGTYTFDNNLTVTWGQFVVPVIRERMVDDTKQLAAGRSVMTSTFSPEYTQGVALSYANDNFKILGAIDDGANTANTAIYSTAEADFAVTGRAEFKWAGDWDQFKDFTSWQGTEGYAGMFGLAGHYQTTGNTGNTTTFTNTAVNSVDTFLYSADVSIEGNGWNAYGAFVGRSVDPDGASSTDEFGALVQGGFFLTEQDELFARWDAIFTDSSVNTSGDDDYHTLTFGVNHYFVAGSHAAKFTGQVQWALSDQAGASTVSGFTTPNNMTGVLPTSQDNQFNIVAQMQLVF